MTTPPPRLAVRLLGGFQVRVGAAVVPDAAWRQRRAAAVVKLLALAPGHLLHREQLSDTLWPDLDLEPSANNLRVALHYARRQLTAVGGEAASEFLVRDGDTLRLGPPARVVVDLDQLEAAIAAVWRTNDLDGAGAALARYTGELLPMDPYEDWVADRRTIVRTSVATLLGRQADWLAAGGRRDQAIAARRRLLTLEPLDEDAHRALIRELAAAGQSGQALAQYDHLVALWEREVGAPPEPATTELVAAIRRGELTPAAITSDPPPPGPPRVPPERLAITAPLPAPLDDLIGRDQEIAELTHLRRRCRLITLTGAGGVGKTRLALAVAAVGAGVTAAGVAFVDLAPLTDPALVLPTIARAVGLAEHGGDPLTRQLAASIGETPLLLVIDNVEHVAAAAPELTTLLAACPNLRLLVTSRVRLRLRGEQEYPVGPLAVPPAPAPLAPAGAPPPLSALLAAPAVALFVRRAAQARPDFTLSSDNAPAVAEICRRLDGLPLALEMAAARVRLLPPADLLARLARPLAVLGTGSRDVAARQQTLRATIAWSYDLLNPDERALFTRLAVFAGGASLAAVEACGGATRDPEPLVLDLAAALVDHSLLRQSADGRGRARLSMLATIHDFARECLEATPGAAAARRRHADWFLALAETAAPALTGPDQADWLEHLELDHDNLRAALSLYQATDPAFLLRLTAALWRFWWVRGHLTEGRRWLEAALAGPALPAEVSSATAHDGAGALAEAQGDFAAATAHHEAALAIWRELADLAGQVRALMNLGLVADVRGEPRLAVTQYEAALDLARASNDAPGIAGCLANLGFATLDLGEHDRAHGYFRESLARFQALGDHRHAVSVLDGLGILAFLQGDYPTAARVQADALAQFESLGDRQGAADALGNLAHTTQRLGDLDLAEERFAAALEQYRALGDQSGTAFALTHLGRLAQARGDPGRAAALLQEGLALSWRLEERTAIIEAMEGLATVALATGEPLQTARLLGAAGALRAQTGVPLPAVYAAEHAHNLLTARAELGDERFTAALAAGEAAIGDGPPRFLPGGPFGGAPNR